MSSMCVFTYNSFPEVSYFDDLLKKKKKKNKKNNQIKSGNTYQVIAYIHVTPFIWMRTDYVRGLQQHHKLQTFQK